MRQASVTRQANEVEEQQLISLAAKVPFDDRICHQASITDMSKLLIGDYLNRVGSSITESDLERMSMEEICRSMHIASGSTEFFKPKNVGLLFFSRKAEEYIPYARIEIVHFHDDVGDHFDEKVLHGPIHLQYEEAMRYLNELLVEKVMKVKGESEAVRVWNYPYQALEEVVANAIFHKSWDDRNPIEIRINKDSIEVYNLAGPTPPITNADLRKEKVINRSYRNRRIGDFLKELHITEGRSTGFPKIYRALKKNDSPLPVFETDEHNQYFLATIKIHEAFIDEDAYLKKIGKERDVVVENEQENGQENGQESNFGELTERQRVILELIRKTPTISLEQMAKKIKCSVSTVRRDLKAMNHIVKRVGGDNGGHWEILC